MAFMTVKLMPGVHVEQTPLLLQAGVVQSNNIRWKGGLPEKLGGWRKFFYTAPGPPPYTVTPGPQAGPIREMWPWADFNAALHLATGGDAGLWLVTDNATDLTPMFNVANVTPNGSTIGFTTASGSSLVHVLGVDTNLTSNPAGSIVIGNYVAVGGLILYGAYPIQQIISGSEIVIDAGALATATVTAGGVVSTFTTTVGSAICTVTLPNHGLKVNTAVFFLPTTLTGSSTAPVPDLIVQGGYTVISVPTANTFTIALTNAATNAIGPISENAGKIKLTSWVVQAPATPGGGWGIGGWGTGGWGGVGIAPVVVTGTKVTAANMGVPWLDWCLTNWGEELIAQPQDGGFFRWSAIGGYSMARPIPEAPAAATGFFLAMPQQQLVAYGASTGASGVKDPMLVRWCDNANYRNWTAGVNTQAGSFRLPRGSMIVGGLQAPMQAVLWTDIGFWLMTYIGYPGVWGFNEVAQECGLIAKKAMGVCGSQIFWMARDKFWTFVGGQVQPLPCEVWDAVFQNLNLNLLDHIRCGTNSGFDEVWWFYPSRATELPGALQENDSYVKLNRVTGEWDYGTPIDVYGTGATGGLMVSDFLDNNVFGHPISAMTLPNGTSSQIMWHEMGRDADTSPMDWWFRTGLFMLSEGEDFIFVDRVRPDFVWHKFADNVTASAQVQITLYTQDESGNPLAPPNVFGPFLCTSSSGPFDPRARGRYFSLKVEGNDVGSFVRLGGVKCRFSPDGRAG